MSNILLQLLTLDFKNLQCFDVLDVMLYCRNIIYPAVDDKADLLQVSQPIISDISGKCQCLVVDCLFSADIMKPFGKEGVWIKVSKLRCQ